jgi:hypothetical protein
VALQLAVLVAVDLVLVALEILEELPLLEWQVAQLEEPVVDLVDHA